MCLAAHNNAAIKAKGTRTGTKRKAQADAAGNGDVLHLIRCTHDSGIDEYDDDLYVDCYGEENDAVEEMVQDALRKLDGTWMYAALAPGSKQQKTSHNSSSSSSSGGGGGMKLFRTLEAANKQAAELFEALLANSPFDGEADDWEGGGDVPQQPKSYETKTADGRSKWERQQWYYYDPLNPGELKNVVASTLTVEVVPASVC
jgi:hypothetical protein